MFVKLLCAYLAGALLGMSLVIFAYPIDGATVILSWPLACVIGWLSGRIVSRLRIFIAAVSMATGVTAPILTIVSTSSLHRYLLVYGGPYIVFAVLGGIASTILYNERIENSGRTP